MAWSHWNTLASAYLNGVYMDDKSELVSQIMIKLYERIGRLTVENEMLREAIEKVIYGKLPEPRTHDEILINIHKTLKDALNNKS